MGVEIHDYLAKRFPRMKEKHFALSLFLQWTNLSTRLINITLVCIRSVIYLSGGDLMNLFSHRCIRVVKLQETVPRYKIERFSIYSVNQRKVIIQTFSRYFIDVKCNGVSALTLKSYFLYTTWKQCTACRSITRSLTRSQWNVSVWI